MLNAKEAEFLALYGRRRVGKTYLIREFFEPQVDTFFTVTGMKDARSSTSCSTSRRSTKAYAKDLKERIELFESITGTRKTVQLALVTVAGLRRNTWSEDLIDNVITAEELFRD